MTDRLLGFLGIALKAGKIASGDTKCEIAARSSQVSLVIMAGDAADNIKKKGVRLAMMSHCTMQTLPCTKEELGEALGNNAISIVCILDKGFANAFLKKMKAQNLLIAPKSDLDETSDNV